MDDGSAGEIVKVSGPLVVARDLPGPRMYDLVRVGESRLMGEIIELRGDNVSVQVYEETGGLGPGDPVFPTGGALSVELGPGLIESIYDGVQRPLNIIREKYGNYIERGVDVPGLSRDREWEFKTSVSEGAEVRQGDILGTIQETSVAEHRVMVPPGLSGRVLEINGGIHKITDVVAVIGTEDKNVEVPLLQKWPVRNARPVRVKLAPTVPLVTGQRVIDTFFPVAKGGTACVPGPFGSGKTVIQHQIAKWADADIILFIGCGERGNEMTEVLLEFPELIDPYSGEPLMKRTVLIANTSNMPVAAREASVYTGITIAEYYRDMGYNVALQADSTSRWAEALREISGRLEEMPGEEGFPAYLGTRLASFYERAGLVECDCSEERNGSITVVGAVSPPGGDLSEPVTQATLRVVKVFWGLEDKLAFRRHFPAINWLVSYSLYLDEVEKEWARMVSPEFAKLRTDAMRLLQEESELQEIVRLIGIEALSPRERLSMESAKSVREDFLQQNAYDQTDSFSSLKKQFLLLRCVMAFDYAGSDAIGKGVEIRDVIANPVREKIAQAKFIPENELEKIDELEKKVWDTLEDLYSRSEVKEALDIF
ncbi:MAG: V-type ATP synthase subunit A [Actinobacteria bacterium]|nr:V-type ATP synthase subunit A [Actinomycetota bacterium]